jgi:signal transduction histidine kinase
MTLTGILEEFLSLSKIDEGRTKSKPEDINVEELVSSVANSLKTSVKVGQVVNYSHTGEDTVFSDPMLLTNVITNLLSNAIKYSPENVPIVLTSKVNHNFTIKVEDHGIGIPVADQAHLFERFYRASNAGNVQGTGLGLHITRHHVELLGGSIEVSSLPGSGTTFTVTLPTGTNRVN